MQQPAKATAPSARHNYLHAIYALTKFVRGRDIAQVMIDNPAVMKIIGERARAYLDDPQ